MNITDSIYEAVKRGNAFIGNLGDVALAGSAVKNFGIVTGDSVIYIDALIFEVLSSSPTFSGKVEFYENTTYTGGTSQPVRNRNRNFLDTIPPVMVSDLKQSVVATPSALNLIGQIVVISNNQARVTTGNAPTMMLKPNTSYVAAVTNSDATSASVFLRILLWRE